MNIIKYNKTKYNIIRDNITNISILIGIFFPLFLNSYGVLIGEKGIEYYSEVHTMPLNSYIHTIFMPISMYGMLLLLPKLFLLKDTDAIYLQKFLYLFFIVHYIFIDFIVALGVAIYYFPTYLFAQRFYLNSNTNGLIKGLFISTISLSIQEVFGHYISGDPPSRIEGIPNAIMYSIYYSVSHIIT